ncbi:MAG: dTDP-4-dehydrorhamnose 3,5-epimerase [Pseudomonadota bacterium]
MQIEETALAGVRVIEPKVFRDARGAFTEAFNARRYVDVVGPDTTFVQDNLSRSARDVLRGLHFQIRQPQGKLVTVFRGAIVDVVVDLRRSSPTFGRHVTVDLTEENGRQLWVPVGCAHGFLSRADDTLVHYKATDFYAPNHERTLIWNDPQISIDWPLDGAPQLSAKDADGQRLVDIETFP